MHPISYVNVFQGSGAIDLPQPQGIAASWHFIKALCGNTHPGAVLPLSVSYTHLYGRAVSVSVFRLRLLRRPANQDN